MIATKCLMVENGIIAIFENGGFNSYSAVAKEDIQLGFTENGMMVVTIKDIIIPLTESLLEHLIKCGGGLFAYAGNMDDYVLSPFVSVEVLRDILLEAKGAYGFAKKQEARS